MFKGFLFLTAITTALLSVSACGETAPASSSSEALNTPPQAQVGPGTPGGGGPGMGMPPGGGMPGGLPPNAEELRIAYPEFIAALEAMQDLDPEARRTAMDALFTEHPEWRELLQPPGGGGMPPGGPGGPMGSPPPAPAASPAA